MYVIKFNLDLYFNISAKKKKKNHSKNSVLSFLYVNHELKQLEFMNNMPRAMIGYECSFY